MNGMDWLVSALALTAMGWVVWYFFLATSEAAATTAPTGNAVTIVVRGGYDPSTVRVTAGQPVQLTFDRQETASCSEEIVFPDFGLRRFLPPNERTTLVVTPPAPGTYEFTCGMSMMHGRLIAE